MAYQTPVAKWLAERRQKFDLKLNEFRWGKSLPIPIYDIEATIKINGKTIEGRGTSTNELLALEKACAEALERMVCQNNFLSTEGVALHTQETSARENARLEALERFLFSWHRERKISFESVHDEHQTTLQDWLKAFSPSANLDFRLMRAPNGYFAPICRITDLEHLFIGLSCGTDLKVALEKALFEAIRNHAAQKASPASYAEAVKTNPDLWCGSTDFVLGLDSLFELKGSSEIAPKIEIKSERLPSKAITGLEDCPIYVERAWVEMGTA